eukprot:XP_011434101.1 PREDICTED: uncharacterized protein LOC105333010 isoform X3 [Crassostrea gigas]
MSHLLEKNCPYEDWTSEARTHCSYPEHFHCLKDDYERTVWLCAEPIWVNKGHCPEYNTGSRLLDLTACKQSKCPQQDYRSNDIDVEYACRYSMDKESLSPTTPFTTKATDTNKHNIGLIVALTMVTLITITIVVAGIILYKCRRQPNRNDGSRDEESIDLMQGTPIETTNRAQRPKNVFDKAKNFLTKEGMVVITGVQGSGKTFLAKSLVDDLYMDGNIKKSSVICSLSELYFGASDKIDIYIIDDIFYELQLYEKFKETLEALNEFLDRAEKTPVIITIPSYTWVCNENEFDNKFYKVHVDLDEREESEKLTMLNTLKTKYDVSSEQTEKVIGLQNDLLVTSHTCIGFPAFVSWIFKQTSIEKMKKCLNHPLKMMSEEIFTMKKAETVEERGKFLVLSYICLRDGRIDLKNVDKKLLHSLKERYAPEFEDEDLSKYCESMVGYYLLTDENGFFEFDLNIMKKIVFVSLANDCTAFVKKHCKHDYVKYVINKKDVCPRNVEDYYTECFTKV